jgi:hypothetical protein
MYYLLWTFVIVYDNMLNFLSFGTFVSRKSGNPGQLHSPESCNEKVWIQSAENNFFCGDSDLEKIKGSAASTIAALIS